MKVQLVWIAALALLAPALSQAAELLSFTVEPLVGYERAQKIVPTPHTNSRYFYGVRVTAGLPLISAEGEATQSQDDEEFPNQSLTTKDKDLKIKAGLRSSYSLSSLITAFVRGGGQATKNTHEEITSGVSVVTDTPIVYKPYAGGGLTIHMGRAFNLTGGVTVVFNDFPNMDKNDYQASLGFTVKFP